MYKKHKTHISKQKENRQRFYALKKHLKGRKSIVRLCFVLFVLFVLFVILLGCVFVLFMLFVHVKSFRKKKNKTSLKLP